ncbi:MAG: CYTH domain-containing protein [Anaerovoracaceae bacterium]
MEIELKYSISDANSASKIWNDEELETIIDKGSRKKETLNAIYYDTEDGDLQNNGIAYRLRREDDILMATLKWRGGSEGALHKREELNINLGEGLFPEEPSAEIFGESTIGKKLLKIIEGKKMQEVMRMNVLRRLFRVDTGDSIFEIAIDNGEIITSAGREAISELEIELFNGSEKDLLKIGEMLQGKYNLEPEKRSKFERGLALLGRINIQEEEI